MLLALLLSPGAYSKTPSLEEICTDDKHFEKKDVNSSIIQKAFQACEKSGTTGNWKGIESSQTSLRASFKKICETMRQLDRQLNKLADKPFPTAVGTVGQCDAYHLASGAYWQSFITTLSHINGIEREHVKMLESHVNEGAAAEKELADLPQSQCKEALAEATSLYYGKLPKEKKVATSEFLAQNTARSFYHSEMAASETYLKERTKRLDELKSQEATIRDRGASCVGSKPKVEEKGHWQCHFTMANAIGYGETEALARANAEENYKSICPSRSPSGNISGPKYILYWIQCKTKGSLQCELGHFSTGGIRG